MDAIDKNILQHLIVNCRVTYQELATKFNLSANAIKKRIKRLEEAGIILKYRLLLSHAMAGTNLLFGLLITDGSNDEVEFVNTLGSNDKIIAAASYTGGHYALVAEFRDSQDLWDIGAFLRSFDCIKHIETHRLLIEPGPIMELTKLHVRVIKALVDDPRKSIVDIAHQSGLTARRVRKLVNELVSSQAVIFSTALELGVAESIPFLMRITWDERATNHRAIASWLKASFPLALWENYISVEAPVIISLLTAENLSEVNAIIQSTRRHKHIPTVTVQITQYHNYFSGLRQKTLKKLIEEAD